MLLALVLMIFGDPPIVGGFSPDVRQSSTAWVTGEGFTGASVRYSAPITITAANVRAEIAAGIEGATPAIDWNTTGQDGQATVYRDDVINANPVIDQGPSGQNPNARAYSFAFAVRSPAGISKTLIGNRPRIFSTSGTDPARLYSGELIAITGQHLAATSVEPTVWLWDGTTPVDPARLYQLPTLSPGGRGTGYTRDVRRSCLFVTVPREIPAGDYYLLASTSENRFGLSEPKAFLVHIMGSPDPWLSSATVLNGAGEIQSGDDITDEMVAGLPEIAKVATEATPAVILLPPGVFYISKSIAWPANVGLIGAGMDATRLVPNPTLEGDFAEDADRIPAGPKGRSGLIRITGSNTLFKDLTLDLAPDESRQTVRALVVAGSGINRARFERVRFTSPLAAENSYGYCEGLIYRWGLWKAWRFDGCEFRGQQIFEGTDGALNGFATNGAFDGGLVLGGSFQSIWGRLSGSTFGPAFGRGTLLYGIDVSRTRRGFAFSAGTGSLESVIACCNFSDMLSEYGNGETILHESRGSAFGAVIAATPTTFKIGKDTTDRARWTVAILSGKGRYQYRLIKSSTAGTHTLEKPWEIVPDATSLVLVVQCPTDCCYVGNRFIDCVGGVTLYGSSFGCLVNSNWMRDSHEGVLVNTNWNTAATSGPQWQLGDGRSASWYLSIRSNTFGRGAGHHFVAARSSADIGTLAMLRAAVPQIAFVGSSFNTYRGDVVNQLWAAEGLEQGGDTNGPGIQSPPLIDCVASTYDQTYTDPSKYLHRVASRIPLARPIWSRTPGGVGIFFSRGNQVDDRPADPATVIGVAP
jgi:hypothetical protein